MRRGMLSVLAVGTAASFEVQLQLGGGQPVYVMENDASMQGFFPGMGQLMSMVNQMQQQQRQQYRTPQNPCQNDQIRTSCQDSACLKTHLEQLSPACAMFLLKTQEAQPSPSPAPVYSSGVFSHTYMGQDGHMHTDSGRLGSAAGRKVQGEMQGMVDLVMSELFGSPQPQQVSPPPPAPTSSGHPCEAEVNHCKQQLNGVTARGPMLQCLVANFTQLTADCKCFLHQVMGDELEQKVAPAKSSTDPQVRTVAYTAAQPAPILLESEVVVVSKPVGHRLTCALFMMIFFLSVFMLLRRLCYCCTQKKPRFAAVVPPQQTVKMSIEPLVATTISTKPLITTTTAIPTKA